MKITLKWVTLPISTFIEWIYIELIKIIQNNNLSELNQSRAVSEQFRSSFGAVPEQWHWPNDTEAKSEFQGELWHWE